MLSKTFSDDSVGTPMTTVDGGIPKELIYKVALELMSRAAIGIPQDFKSAVKNMCVLEKNPLSKFVLNEIQKNYEVAEADQRPMCGDTGLPRWYVKLGNECRTQGGFVELESNLRRATADATKSIPLRPNRVHPLTRKDHNNNLGIHAPEVQYAFEPDGEWLDLTTVHKGGLFGTDYRMLFPADGIDGIKKFFLDTMVQFGRRGMAC